MQTNGSLRITKGTIDVDVRDARGEVRRVEVFVTEGVTAEGRGERLQDIFRDRRFIPVKNEKRLEFVSCPHITWVKMDLISALDELDPEAEQTDGSASASVRVDLDDGSWVEGVVRYYLPVGFRRLADYLAALPAFFPLRTPDWLYLVNRERVLRVVPLNEG